MGKLVLQLPDGTTLDIPLDRERITIGRRGDNDVCLPNLAVSSLHAAVVTVFDDSFLEDLGSTNGTLVNGKPIVKHLLRDGDEIDIGRHKLIYRLDADVVLEPDVAGGMSRAAVVTVGVRARPVAKSRSRSPTGATPPARNDTGLASLGTPPAAPSDAVPAAERTLKMAKLATPSTPVGTAGSDAASQPFAFIKVVTGANAGRSIPLVRRETTIGRPGVQVAMIVRREGGFMLKPLEGEQSPLVNGRPVSPEGVKLAQHDVIELARTRLQFVVAESGAKTAGSP